MAETLGYFDIHTKTHVIPDMSPYGLGALLVQIQKVEHRVMPYASRSLSQVKCQYSQTEWKPLARVWAYERFHSYAYGIEFNLVTDHKPLEFIYSSTSKPCQNKKMVN